MQIINRWSAKKRREKHIITSLAGIASAEAVSDDFRAASALVRAYGVALGITVPEHATRILFTDEVSYLREAWKIDDLRIADLASYLSWTQTKAAFNDMEELAESEEQADRMRLMLMTVTGRVFPASERAMTIMHDFSDALESRERQEELRETAAFLDLEHPSLCLHFRAVAQALDKPWKKEQVPVDIAYDAQRFLALLSVEATSYFKRRALEIFKAHIEHGVRPI
jgi:hypothetical protein